ncbi:MAG: zinc ribbon-containing protein [Coriobacteriia bacterium]|nr:zinc ribbon-containing protein [Coriobacteriia bacterium]
MLRAGDTPGAGRYQCLVCGTRLDLEDGDALPRCPFCHGTGFHQVHE